MERTHVRCYLWNLPPKAGIFLAASYIGFMKMILAVITVICGISMAAHAQDSALEERVNKLTGYVQDLLAAQEAQRKQIEALATSVESLRERVGQSSANTSTQEDLRKLAEKIQEVDRKREADRELILKELDGIAKAASRPRKTEPSSTSTSNVNEKGFEYVVEEGNTLSAIAAAYRERGIKVTVDDILKANPNLKATSLKVGQKIFIPSPK